MIRVLLVDDHVAMRAGTRALLGDAPEIEIIAECGSGREALELAARLRPDVVMLDIQLPDLNGVEVSRALRQDLPEIKVIMLTAYNYEQYVRALFAIGVHGYLLKSDTGPELIEAVRTVMSGEQALSREIAAALAVQRAGPRSGAAAVGSLSEREREVLGMVGNGLRNKEIALRLQLKRSTVDTYIAHIMAKLEVHSRSHALRLAVERGIIVLDGDPIDAGS